MSSSSIVYAVATYANQLSRATLGNSSSHAKEKIVVAPKKLRVVAGKLSLVMKAPDDVFFEVSFSNDCEEYLFTMRYFTRSSDI